jgi:hypothetical protein
MVSMPTSQLDETEEVRLVGLGESNPRQTVVPNLDCKFVSSWQSSQKPARMPAIINFSGLHPSHSSVATAAPRTG